MFSQHYLITFLSNGNAFSTRLVSTNFGKPSIVEAIKQINSEFKCPIVLFFWQKISKKQAKEFIKFDEELGKQAKFPSN